METDENGKREDIRQCPVSAQQEDKEAARLTKMLHVTGAHVDIHEHQMDIGEIDPKKHLHLEGLEKARKKSGGSMESQDKEKERIAAAAIYDEVKKGSGDERDAIQTVFQEALIGKQSLKKERAAGNGLVKTAVESTKAVKKTARKTTGKYQAIKSGMEGRTDPEKRKHKRSIKNSLNRLEEKEKERDLKASVEKMERRLRVSRSNTQEERRQEKRSSVSGRLHVTGGDEPADGEKEEFAEKQLRTERSSRKYKNTEEMQAIAAKALKTIKEKKERKKQENRKNSEKSNRKEAGKRASVSNIIQKGIGAKQQLDSGEVFDVSTGQGFLNLMTHAVKNMGQAFSSEALKKLMMVLLGFVVHLLAVLISGVVNLLGIILGVLLAVIGPILVIIICVASIFSFLFVKETGVVDTSAPNYIDNYISALLAEFRDSITSNYANEPYAWDAAFLQYDVLLEIQGRVSCHVHDIVSYGEGTIMDEKNIKVRKSAVNDTLNDYFGRDSKYRKEFMDDLKMIYFAKMYSKDDVVLPEGADGSEQMAPYLMIDAREEEEMLTKVFNEFCRVNVDKNTHPSWVKGNRPYPYKINGNKLLDEEQKLYETMAETVTVEVKTIAEYIASYPLTPEEKGYYDEFAKIKFD